MIIIRLILISLLTQCISLVYALGDTTQVVKDQAQMQINEKGNNIINNYGISIEQFTKLAADLGVSDNALANFFKILDKEKVERADLDKKLREVAEHYKKLLENAKLLENSDDPTVKELLNQAEQFLEGQVVAADFSKAETLLQQAFERERDGIVALQEMEEKIKATKEKKQLSAAGIIAQKGILANTQLRYQEAADAYQSAAKLVPASHQELQANYLNEAGVAYRYAGAYHQAKSLFEEALAIRERVFGPQHPDYATSLNNLADLYQSEGEYDKALPLFEQVIKTFAQMLGEQHPDYATSLNNLAFLYKSQGEYEKALPLYEKALHIREQVLGKQHPDYAQSLNNLAVLFDSQGETEKALLLYQQALQIREQVLGKQHPDYAQSLNNLALLYYFQGDYQKAMPLFEQAVKIFKHALGLRHPDYATSLNNLAFLYKKQGDVKKALPLYEESLQIVEEVLGKQHPDYAMSLNNLAFLHKSQGDYEKALSLFEQALKIFEQALGKQHLDYATGLNNLAFLYDSQGDYEKAVPLFEEAAAIVEKKMGKNHQDTKTFADNLQQAQQHLNGQYQVVVKTIFPNSQALHLGIQVGDVFVNYDNQPILGVNRFIYRRSRELKTGPPKELTVLRDGRELIFRVSPGKIGAELDEQVIFPSLPLSP